MTTRPSLPTGTTDQSSPGDGASGAQLPHVRCRLTVCKWPAGVVGVYSRCFPESGSVILRLCWLQAPSASRAARKHTPSSSTKQPEGQLRARHRRTNSCTAIAIVMANYSLCTNDNAVQVHRSGSAAAELTTTLDADAPTPALQLQLSWPTTSHVLMIMRCKCAAAELTTTLGQLAIVVFANFAAIIMLSKFASPACHRDAR